jgi:hypothetical protein
MTMNISKTGKIIIGILTVLQLFIALFYFIWIFSTLIPIIISGNEEAISAAILASLAGIFFWAIFLCLLSLAMFVFYIVHAGTNTSLSTTMKVVWILLLFFIGSVAEVVYFFMEIVPQKSMTARLDDV